MKRMTMVVALVSIALMCGGCLSRAIKESVGAATGPKGFFAETKAPPSKISSYQNIEVGPINDRFGRTPGQLLATISGAITEKLREEKLPTGAGGKTLVIRGVVIYYEKSGAAGQLFGPFEEVVTEMEMVDKASGQVIATANCIGRSTTSVNKGVDDKTKGLAKGIVKWVAKHYPKDDRPGAD